MLANLRGRDRLVAKGENGGARKSVEAFDFGELGDDVFGDAVAKVFVFLDAAEIFEIEDGDGFYCGLCLIGGRRLRMSPDQSAFARLLAAESRSRLRRLRSVLSSVGGLVAQVAVFLESFATNAVEIPWGGED